MIDISVRNVKKAFEEGNDILDDISFDINEGEKVGLLGKNGAGKTTLLRLITGELEPDEGTVAVTGFKKTGLISQIPEYPAGYTGEDVMQTAFNRLKEMKAGMEELERKMADGGDVDVLKAYDSLAYEYERLGGYNTGHEINRVANGLRIPPEQRERSFDRLSGGEKTRINLARLMLEKTDILLLDEPTNHLDMRATLWLEEFLGKYGGTVLIISHDRYFLDKTIDRAIEINAGKAEFYGGNYSFYVTEKQRRYEEQLERYEREQAEAKRLRDAAARLHQWGTGNEMLMKKSRSVLKRAERAQRTERPDRDKSMHAKFEEKEFRADELLVIKDLKKSFDAHSLFEIGELEVHGGERIALIGDNGTGKTTLVKIIMGEESPDSGIVRRGPAVKPAYLPQVVRFDNPRRSILDTLTYELNMSPQLARNRLGAFLFPGEDVFKLVGELSGGEKSRLRLCMLMSGKANLLILDEPTNHLDLPSREWIESAVGDFGETIVFISHDRYFIDRFATRVWEIEDGAFTDFSGSFAQFLEYKRSAPGRVSSAAGGVAVAAGRQTVSPSGSAPAAATPRSGSAGPVQRAAKPNKKPSDIPKEIRRLEREILKAEGELESIRLLMEEHSSDYVKLIEYNLLEQEASERIDVLYREWETLS
ncbi:MAG: ABC-F family ATP-binding cassette domain-containing protein [Oscillospiraceae bacterium]|nr:ABC-F family ATP-binding cassette domain-containing protein [Oscillospiraceae bacterium]